jgi:hypothetical protein
MLSVVAYSTCTTHLETSGIFSK